MRTTNNSTGLTAKGDYSALETLALAEESASDSPERYTLLKHYAQLEQQQGWSEADEALRNWLSDLGQQRDVLGSAWANAWLHALGHALPDEVIILPEEGPKRASAARKPAREASAGGILLEAYPNPANTAQWLAYRLPEGVEKASLLIRDLLGREVMLLRLSNTTGIAELPVQAWPIGMYSATIILDGVNTETLKLIVKR